MKSIFATVIFLVGTILTVAALLSRELTDTSTVWGIAGWSSLLVIVNWIAPGMLISKSGGRNTQLGATPAAAVAIGIGSILSMAAITGIVIFGKKDLLSTANLIVQTVIVGLTLATVSICFVSASGAAIKGGALKTEDRDRLLSGLSQLLRHVQDQYPALVSNVRELDSCIRNKTPHPSMIEHVSKYHTLIEFANDERTFNLDEEQLSSSLDQMRQTAIQLK